MANHLTVLRGGSQVIVIVACDETGADDDMRSSEVSTEVDCAFTGVRTSLHACAENPSVMAAVTSGCRRDMRYSDKKVSFKKLCSSPVSEPETVVALCRGAPDCGARLGVGAGGAGAHVDSRATGTRRTTLLKSDEHPSTTDGPAVSACDCRAEAK